MAEVSTSHVKSCFPRNGAAVLKGLTETKAQQAIHKRAADLLLETLVRKRSHSIPMFVLCAVYSNCAEGTPRGEGVYETVVLPPLQVWGDL